MTQETIKATLEDYATAYCAKDIDSLMHVFDDTDNISVIGTGMDELCVGRSAVKDLFLRNFSEATANKFEWDWVDIRLSGSQVPLRWTVVVKNQNGRWVWIHRHASTPASTQEEGHAYPKDN